MTYPIVLSHGVCRFDQLWNDAFDLDNSNEEDKDLWHYFKGIRSMLRSKGFEVFHTRVPWAASVEERARALRKNIAEILQQSGKAKINIIAHSMGGLDARHMLFNDRYEGNIHERIASLTTISTPHWGSSFADWGIRHVGDAKAISKALGLNVDAFQDLTVAECTRYNQQQAVIDFEQDCESRIRFQTYACQQNFFGIFGPLKIPFYFIENEEGENDGLVSVKSAKWRERYYQRTFKKTDHVNALGWWDPDQIFAFESDSALLKRIHREYAEIARALP